jgi:hypothetical protein
MNYIVIQLLLFERTTHFARVICRDQAFCIVASRLFHHCKMVEARTGRTLLFVK